MKRLLDDQAGSAAVEFALVAPLAVLLILGLRDTVLIELAAMDLESAASAGAMAVLKHGGNARRIDEAIAGAGGKYVPTIEIVRCETPLVSALCAALPFGRYARVTVRGNDVPPPAILPARPLVAVAMVRLP